MFEGVQWSQSWQGGNLMSFFKHKITQQLLVFTPRNAPPQIHETIAIHAQERCGLINCQVSSASVSALSKLKIESCGCICMESFILCFKTFKTFKWYKGAGYSCHIRPKSEGYCVNQHYVVEGSGCPSHL